MPLRIPIGMLWVPLADPWDIGTSHRDPIGDPIGDPRGTMDMIFGPTPSNTGSISLVIQLDVLDILKLFLYVGFRTG